MVRVMVCGSIGYGYAEEIKRIQRLLRDHGYEVLDQFGWDYTHVEDFRDKPDLCGEIVRRDLELCEKADVIVLIAHNPSFGAMAEIILSSLKGKKIIAFCPKKVKSPWPIYFADVIVKSEDELVEALKSIKIDGVRTIPNVYCDHDVEFRYEGFTCICPVTGRRDFAVIKIKYKPRDRLLEYESLEAYMEGFRDKVLHHEAVVCKITNDLFEALKPEWLEVIAEFEERSGVKAVVRNRKVYV
jgi:7-cyano-7-deazaguanine reductase